MVSDDYPYQQYEGTHNWKIVEHAINDLVENGDLIERTNRRYVVGYICKLLAEPASNRSVEAERK